MRTPTPSRDGARAAARRRTRRALPIAPLLAGLLAALLAGLLGARDARAVAPEWAAAGSVLLPGLGQAVNGDLAEGAAYGTLYLVMLRQFAILTQRPDYLHPSKREDTSAHTLALNRTTVVADQYGTALLDLSFYSAYAAYRDGRARPEYADRYRTPAPTESLQDLARAPFRWEWLRRPTTLAPLLIPLYLAFSPASAERLVYAPQGGIHRDELRLRYFVQFNGVAVGEEAFYRGFLNNGLSNALGEGWGLATSSLVFGLSHQGQGAQASALGATLLGAYLGWLQQTNDYQIGQGVAVHFWWNFLASLALLKTHPQATVTPVTLTLRF